ncbi:MAG: inorganic phosphate transporter [Bacteroidales bacterium]|nr:inorganic phosphate transporter [Bacteroidales bacterium]
MENLYIILVIILFALAISDLIVGVSNDAVNFLNSAIGSKAAPFKVIMVIAAIGILVGVTFSSGMMEVARKSIFHPDQFYFYDIMIIFLAVMITDVILLDMFNTFGLPTSTTVSIVFELLGAAVAVAIIKILDKGESIQDLGTYINSAKALAIIAGILLSVVVAFSIGALVQYVTRLIFSFDYKKSLKYLGSLWGGSATTAITFFILIKGAKGASFMSDDTVALIKENTLAILGFSFVAWTIILQFLYWLFRINILKLIVLVGTFALAMAFAGNDLVNFIGVPLAGLESFKIFSEAAPGVDPELFSMEALQGKIKTPTLYLLCAGIIMVITLWISRKAKSVVKTTLDLSRQDEGSERFGSSGLSRSIVRSSINFGKIVRFIIPKNIQEKASRQFEPPNSKNGIDNDAPSFDLLRASVNLVVASILISFGTSLKLPLSTTYVTFMVAMGTSLSDQAWGRESAVYRITGVLSVVGGWFLTALSAFTVAFLVALFFYWGGIITIGIGVLLTAIIIYRTRFIHKKREEKNNDKQAMRELVDENNISLKCANTISKIISDIKKIYTETIIGLNTEDHKLLKKSYKAAADVNSQAKLLKDNLDKMIVQLKDDSIETGHYYVQVLDFLRELAHDISFITGPSFEHVNNNHKALITIQTEELETIKDEMSSLFQSIKDVIDTNDFVEVDNILAKQQNLLSSIESSKKSQIKRIKNQEVGTRNSMLYLNILSESKNLVLNIVNLLKSQRDFVNYTNSNNISNPNP